MKNVWVAIVNTRYEVIAVAETEAEAVETACRRAYKFLYDREALSDETDTWEKVREYFGVTAIRVPVGSAVFLDGTDSHG